MLQRKHAIAPNPNTKPLWTPEESLNFEVAQGIIDRMIGVCFDKVRLEKLKDKPDLKLIATLEKEEGRLHKERMELSWKDHAKIEKIFKEYGAQVKAYNESKRKAGVNERH